MTPEQIALLKERIDKLNEKAKEDITEETETKEKEDTANE